MRRALIAATLLTLLAFATACPPVGAQAPELVRVGAGPDDQSLPLVYGVKSGIYKKYGLNVELVKLAGAAAVAAALAGGSLEVGKGATVSVVTAISRGLPFTIIGIANKAWVSGHGDAVNRFLRATREADAYLGSHENESPALMAGFIGADPSRVANFKHEERNIIVTAAGLQPVIDTMVKYKVLASPVAAADLICPCALRN